MTKQGSTISLRSIAIAFALALAAFVLGRVWLFPSPASDPESLGRQQADAERDVVQTVQPVDPELNVTLASVEYSPEQVVSLQVNALIDSKLDPDRVAVCYGLASPNNRLVTGPLERFASMVRTPPYDRFFGALETQVGKAELEEDFANVLVSGISETNQPFAYRFLLSRQTSEPFTGCWMTDAVIPLSFVDFQGTAIAPTEAIADGIPLQ